MELEGSILSYYDEYIKHEINHLFFKRIARGCINLGYINLYARFNDLKIKSIINDLIDYMINFMQKENLEPKNYSLKLHHNDYPNLNYNKINKIFNCEFISTGRAKN